MGKEQAGGWRRRNTTIWNWNFGNSEVGFGGVNNTLNYTIRAERQSDHVLFVGVQHNVADDLQPIFRLQFADSFVHNFRRFVIHLN